MDSENTLDKIKGWTNRISLWGMVIGTLLTFTNPFYYWLGPGYAEFGVPGMITFLISFIIYICIQFINKEFDWIFEVAFVGMVLGVVFIYWAPVNYPDLIAVWVGQAVIGTSILINVILLFRYIFHEFKVQHNNCGQEIRAKQEEVGQDVDCPECGASVYISTESFPDEWINPLTTLSFYFILLAIVFSPISHFIGTVLFALGIIFWISPTPNEQPNHPLLTGFLLGMSLFYVFFSFVTI